MYSVSDSDCHHRFAMAFKLFYHFKFITHTYVPILYHFPTIKATRFYYPVALIHSYLFKKLLLLDRKVPEAGACGTAPKESWTKADNGSDCVDAGYPLPVLYHLPRYGGSLSSGIPCSPCINTLFHMRRTDISDSYAPCNLSGWSCCTAGSCIPDSPLSAQ